MNMFEIAVLKYSRTAPREMGTGEMVPAKIAARLSQREASGADVRHRANAVSRVGRDCVLSPENYHNLVTSLRDGRVVG